MNATVTNHRSNRQGALIESYNRTTDGELIYEVETLSGRAHWLASSCSMENVDFYTGETEDEPQAAEGRVHGAVRGGIIIDGFFCTMVGMNPVRFRHESVPGLRIYSPQPEQDNSNLIAMYIKELF